MCLRLSVHACSVGLAPVLLLNTSSVGSTRLYIGTAAVELANDERPCRQRKPVCGYLFAQS